MTNMVKNVEVINSKNDYSSDKLKEEISNFFEDLMYDYGGSPLLGRIYSICVMDADKSFLQEDLQKEFKVNPSTISRNLKELESWNLISKRREPGERKWQYQLNNTSFLELFLHTFDESNRKLQDKREELQRIKEHWADQVDEETFESLNKLIDWMELVEDELNTFIANLNKKYVDFEKKIVG